MLTQHVHAVCPQTIVLWNNNLAAFCKSDINIAPYYVLTALIIAKITEMMVSLPRDTVATARRSYGGTMRPCWRLAEIFK
jgi:hypothetical protein